MGDLDLPPVPTLEFSTEGNFTILQVADLHLSTGPGACRDLSASQVGKCEALGADEYSLRLFRRGLDELEKEMGAKGKGLVVFTGDQCVLPPLADPAPDDAQAQWTRHVLVCSVDAAQVRAPRLGTQAPVDHHLWQSRWRTRPFDRSANGAHGQDAVFYWRSRRCSGGRHW